MKKFLCLRTSSRPIPRVLRMMKVAEDLGLESKFIGAYREESLPEFDSWENMTVQRSGSFYPMLNGLGLLKYIKGVFSFNYHALKILRNEKAQIVHVSDVESFPAAFIYKLFNNTKIIYNIHDNFAQRYAVPKIIKMVLNFFEGLIILYSNVTIVPEKFRADALPRFAQKKITVIRNTPVDPGYSLPRDGSCGEEVRIVFAGWLDFGRGLDSLIRLSNEMEKIKVVVAGEGSDEIIEKIKNCENIEYKGFLNHKEVLELTKDSDFVFAHYSPHREINRFAAPNKLAEALAVGRPVIINSEAKISELVSRKKCGVVTSYDDVKDIISNIKKITENEGVYKEMSIKSRELFEAEYSWSLVKEKTQKILCRLIKESK